MAENFELGFSIDTSALRRAADEAAKAAASILGLGNAEREQAKAAAQSAQATGSLGKAMQDAGRTSQGLDQELQRVTGTLRASQSDLMTLASALRGQQGLIGGLDAAAGSLVRMAGALGPVGIAAAAVTVGLGILGKAYFDLSTTLGQAQDKLQQLEGRLSNSLGSMAAARDAIQQLRETTQETGLGFDSAADAFARIARNNDAIGLTRGEMLQLVETTQKLGAVSGASAGEMQAGMIQFGQALASGKLQGDELRSIMENFPALAKAIADNFEASDGKIGVSIGTLRRLGSEGELTGNKIADAVLKATQQADAEYAKIPDTIERANRRVADSWSELLAELGKRLDSSGFVQDITNATNEILKGAKGAVEVRSPYEQIRALEKQLPLSQEFESMSRMGRAAISGPYGQPPMPSSAAVTAEIARLRAQMNKDLQESVDAAQQDTLRPLIASGKTAEAIGQQYASPADKLRRIDADIATITEGIAKTREAIKAGGTKDDTVGDLAKTIEVLEKNLSSAQLARGRALEGDRSVLANLLRDAQDAATARSMGGAGGGQGIYLQALQQQRQDAGKGMGGRLEDYVSAGLNAALRQSQDSLESMARSSEKVRSQIALVGAERAKVIELEIEQESAAEQARIAGTLSSKALVDYMAQYKTQLRESKTAADALAAANKALGAERNADLARRLATGMQDPASQARIREDFELEQARRDMGGGEAYSRFERATRGASESARGQRFSQMSRGLDLSATEAAEQAKLARLGSDEYRVQNALLAKRMEFLREGISLEDSRAQAILKQVELLERAKIASDKATAGTRAIIRSLENGAAQMEGVFKNSFETLFTDGVKKAGDIFGKGFGDIVKKIAADMIYEIGYRALNEIAAQMAVKLGNWFLQFLPGGGGAAAGSGASPTFGRGYDSKFSGSSDFAAGGVFSYSGLSRFAGGGSFTNRLVDKPTLFAFAGGAGLMGEAGPEAIMPLRRGADGRLGVSSSNGGGDVQVIVNDMRSSAGAEPVETKSGRGPDGRRMISVMIRDEMRRQIRSGDMDKDMAMIYGNQRQLTRK